MKFRVSFLSLLFCLHSLTAPAADTGKVILPDSGPVPAKKPLQKPAPKKTADKKPAKKKPVKNAKAEEKKIPVPTPRPDPEETAKAPDPAAVIKAGTDAVASGKDLGEKKPDACCDLSKAYGILS